MGVLGMPAEMPDTFGLPEYFISEVVTEIDGPNVRMICGVKRGGVVHWLYSCVMRAENLMGTGRQVTLVAEESFHLQHMLERRGDH